MPYSDAFVMLGADLSSNAVEHFSRHHFSPLHAGKSQSMLKTTADLLPCNKVCIRNLQQAVIGRTRYIVEEGNEECESCTNYDDSGA